jgi:hypothetical protein
MVLLVTASDGQTLVAFTRRGAALRGQLCAVSVVAVLLSARPVEPLPA